MLRALTLCLPIVLIAGCHCPHEEGTPAEAIPVDPTPLASAAVSQPIRPIARGTQSGLVTAEGIVVRSLDDWRFLWSQHAEDRVPSVPEPPVDFDTEMVVGVTLGQRPSTGYEVEILGVTRDAEQLVVRSRATEPPEGSVQAQVMTAPYDFVAVPRYDGKVMFTYE